MFSVRGIVDPERDLGHIDRHRNTETPKETEAQKDAPRLGADEGSGSDGMKKADPDKEDNMRDSE